MMRPFRRFLLSTADFDLDGLQRDFGLESGLAQSLVIVAGEQSIAGNRSSTLLWKFLGLSSPLCSARSRA
jgi:hypothetical protein